MLCVQCDVDVDHVSVSLDSCCCVYTCDMYLITYSISQLHTACQWYVHNAVPITRPKYFEAHGVHDINPLAMANNSVFGDFVGCWTWK